MKTLTKIALAAMLALIVTGCGSTKINIEVERPPTLNTTGIKRIAIMPFEANCGGCGEVAQQATTTAMQNIVAMNHFTFVDYSVIANLMRNKQSIENHVDAVLIGRVTRVGTGSNTEQYQVRNKDGSVSYRTNYITTVEVDFNYSLMRARDGSLVGPVVKTGRSRQTSSSGYPSAQAMLRAEVTKQLQLIGRDLAPYKVKEKRAFEEDKAQKDKMKAALDQVKQGNLKPALKAYIDIYEESKSVAAAINASYLYEGLGEIQAAVELMQRVVDEVGNNKAMKILADLNKIIKDKETIASDYSGEAQKPQEKVTALAIEEIVKVLPETAKVWIHNGSNNNMLDAIVDNITSELIKKGVGIVDRENMKLIASEQKLQMSGAVSDEDIVKLGNASGASTIVILDISGEGATRRLKVKVLDIEKAMPIFQSDAGENWQL